MKRLGLVPGTGLIVDPGRRNASLLVRIGGRPPCRLRHELATEILVVRESPSDETGNVITDRAGVQKGLKTSLSRPEN
jgi:hypothetical protein